MSLFHLYNKENGAEKQAGTCCKCSQMGYGVIKEGKYYCTSCASPSQEKQQDPLFDKKYQKHLKELDRKKKKKKRDEWYVPKDKFFGE